MLQKQMLDERQQIQEQLKMHRSQHADISNVMSTVKIKLHHKSSQQLQQLRPQPELSPSPQSLRSRMSSPLMSPLIPSPRIMSSRMLSPSRQSRMSPSGVSPHRLQGAPSSQQQQMEMRAHAQQMQRMQNMKDMQHQRQLDEQMRRQRLLEDKIQMQERELRQQGHLIRKLGSGAGGSADRVRRIAIRAKGTRSSCAPQQSQEGSDSPALLRRDDSPALLGRNDSPALLRSTTDLAVSDAISNAGNGSRKPPRKHYRHAAIETRLRNSQTEMVVYFVVLLATIIGLWTVLDIYGRRLSTRGTNGTLLLFPAGSNKSVRVNARGGGAAGHGFVIGNASESPGFRICSTAACQYEGSFVSHQLNWNVNPCESMYHFVCSNWHAAHPTLHTADEAVINELEDSLLASLRYAGGGLYTTNVTGSGFSSSLSAMQDFWKECVNSQSRNHLGWGPLKHLLKATSLGDWPYVQFSTKGEDAVWEVAARALRFLGLPTLVRLEMVEHPTRRQRIVPAFDKPQVLRAPYDAEHNDTHSWYYEVVALAVSATTHRNVAIHSVTMEVVNFAHHLEGIVRSPAASLPRDFKLEKLRSLPRYRAFLTTFLENASRVDDDTELVLRAPEYIVRLTYLLDDTPPHIVLNYMGFLTVVHVSPFLPDVLHKLVVVRGRQLGLSRRATSDQLCMRITAEVMPTLFYRNTYEAHRDSIEVTSVLSGSVRQALIQRLEQLHWMDRETQTTSADRLRAIELRPLLPTASADPLQATQEAHVLPRVIPGEGLRSYARLTRYLVQRRITEGWEPRPAPWFDPKCDDECGFDLAKRTLYLPLTAANLTVPLEEPLTLLQLPRFGVRVGRCLARSLLEGAAQGHRPNDPRFWWTATSREGLAALHRCYSLQQRGGEEAARTAAEDSAALVAAHVAFRGRLPPGVDLRFENAVSMSLDQLFFIYYALSQCSDDLQVTRRVDLALLNYKGFQKAFTCDSGTPMNPRKTCDFW